MLRAAIGLATVIFLAGSSLAYAQDASRQRSQADINARIDLRFAAAKAALQLTPDQQKYWPPVEDAVRAAVQGRYARIAKVDQRLSQRGEIDPIEVFRARANVLEQRGAELKKVVDAWEPLYKSLTPDQKQRMRFVAENVLPALRVAVQTGRMRGFNEGASRTQQPGSGGTVGTAPR